MRILTVTENANVAVGLSMRGGDDREVITVRSVDELDAYAYQRFDAALLVLSTVPRGVVAAAVIREHVGDVPCVIVGPPVADEVQERLPPGVTLLASPVQLDAVEEELARVIAGQPSPGRTRPTEADPIGSTPMPELQEVTTSQAPTPAEEERDERPAPTGAATPAEAPEARERTEPPQPTEEPEVSETPEPPAEPEARDVPEAAPQPPPADTRTPTAPGRPRPEPTEPQRAQPNRRDQVASRQEAARREEPAGADDGGSSMIDRLRRHRRREPQQQNPSGTEATGLPGPERLERAAGAGERLLQLVADVPGITRRRLVGHALVEKVARQVPSQSVVLWAPDGRGGFEALASVGIPAQVVKVKPPPDQPMLRDLSGDRDAIIYTPTERFPPYLHELPGLRTGGMVLGATLRAHTEVHGILIASGGDYGRDALEFVGSAAAPHGLALATAAHLEFLRHRASLDLPHEDDGGEQDAAEARPAVGTTPLPPSELPPRERLEDALAAAEELQGTLDVAPALNRRHHVARAILGEITASVTTETAVLWAPDGRGAYEALAWVGARAEAMQARPSRSQPLLRAVTEGDGTLVRTPGEEGDPEVASLPALEARSNVLGAALRARGELHGIVLLGGGTYDDRALQSVRSIGQRRAAALAVAAQLEVLRGG